MRLVKRTLELLAVTVVAAGVAPADTFYNNLGTAVSGYGSVAGYQGLWNSFSTGSKAENLTDVQVKLEQLAPDPPTPSVTIQLYANSGNKPGAVLLTIGSINDSQVSPTGGTYDFPVNPGYALSANTRYWIGITTSTGSVIEWAWNDESVSAATGTGTAGEYHCYGTSSCVANGNDPFLMMVTGTVPSPTVPMLTPVALVALGLLLTAIPLWMLRKKRPLPI